MRPACEFRPSLIYPSLELHARVVDSRFLSYHCGHAAHDSLSLLWSLPSCQAHLQLFAAAVRLVPGDIFDTESATYLGGVLPTQALAVRCLRQGDPGVVAAATDAVRALCASYDISVASSLRMPLEGDAGLVR